MMVEIFELEVELLRYRVPALTQALKLQATGLEQLLYLSVTLARYHAQLTAVAWEVVGSFNYLPSPTRPVRLSQ